MLLLRDAIYKNTPELEVGFVSSNLSGVSEYVENTYVFLRANFGVLSIFSG